MAELERIRTFHSPLAAAQQEDGLPHTLASLDEVDVNPSVPKEYFDIVMRHKLLIVCLAAAGVIASFLLNLTTQPTYQTRTSLDIQSLNSDFMNIKSVDPTANTPTDTAIQTQIKLLESESLEDKVKERLSSEPHSASIPRADLLSRIEHAVHIGRKDAIPFSKLLDETANGVKVKPLGITQLVEITCDSWDASFAARYCNTLTSEYQNEDLESRGDQARRTSDWLMHQAADIREKAEESQQRLIAATGGDGLILAEQSDSVGEDGLRQLQGELVKAEADRMEKQAEVASMLAHGATAMPSGSQSAAYAADRVKLSDLQQQLAALVPPLTEANPRVIHLRAQIQAVKRNLASESSASETQMEDEYKAARHREELLQMAYRARENDVSSDLQKASQVDLLRREVESEQQLYQTLLQRAKEAGFASAMQATTIRVVDAARRPVLPIYPRRLMGSVIGLLLGAVLGLILSFFQDRHSTVLRMPGESERLLQIAELGAIPSPRAAALAVPAQMRTKPLKMLSMPSRIEASADTWRDKFSLIAEAYRNITHSILVTTQREPRVFTVMSPNAGEGKTTVTSNIGIGLSQAGLRVLVVDADLRKPKLHIALGVANDLGLYNALDSPADAGSISVARLCKPTRHPNLSVLPSGTRRDNVGRAFHSAAFPKLLRTLSSIYEVILIDSPPMLHIADARIIARETDGAILVFRAGFTTRDQARNMRILLDRDHVHVVGSILNNFDPRRAGKYGYYKSYYAYQQGMAGDAER